jgi:hypothetical protein
MLVFFVNVQVVHDATGTVTTDSSMHYHKAAAIDDFKQKFLDICKNAADGSILKDDALQTVAIGQFILRVPCTMKRDSECGGRTIRECVEILPTCMYIDPSMHTTPCVCPRRMQITQQQLPLGPLTRSGAANAAKVITEISLSQRTV